MNPPHFQFTVRSLLWATFWVAMTAAAWRYAVTIGPMTPRVSQGVAIGVMFWAPLLALLSVFSRTKLTLGICLGIWLVWVFLLLFPWVPVLRS